MGQLDRGETLIDWADLLQSIEGDRSLYWLMQVARLGVGYVWVIDWVNGVDDWINLVVDWVNGATIRSIGSSIGANCEPPGRLMKSIGSSMQVGPRLWG